MKAAGPLLALLVGACLRGQPAWVGLAVTGPRTAFALRAGAAGSQWLEVGGEIGGWKIVSFQAEAGTLLLADSRGGFATVRLRDAAVPDLSPDARAMTAALRVAADRDGWTGDAQADPPQHRDGQYRVLVRRGVAARMVILAEDGTVLDDWKV